MNEERRIKTTQIGVTMVMICFIPFWQPASLGFNSTLRSLYKFLLLVDAAL